MKIYTTILAAPDDSEVHLEESYTHNGIKNSIFFVENKAVDLEEFRRKIVAQLDGVYIHHSNISK